MQKQSERLESVSPTQRQKPLLTIPEAHAVIYSHGISISSPDFRQPPTAHTGQAITIKEGVSTILQDKLEDKHQKLILFSNPSYAFNVIEQTNTIEIHNIGLQTIECSIKVEQAGTLHTIQSLLRRKMCEMGFERRYNKLQKLGSGATAEVFLVSRKSDGKLFAAKIISIKESSEKAYDTFINEAKLLRVINHRKIVALESLYVQKKLLIEVLEYLDGGTLLQKLRQNQFKEGQKWLIIKDITEGLEHLRQKRIVHRDLKLENIMVRKGPTRDEFILTDFGLATWMGQHKPLFERCGTPGYIAPEVLQAEKGKAVLDHRIDIFSLGVIAHLVFLLQPLFQFTGSVKDLLRANKRAEYSLESPIYDRLSLNELSFLEASLEKKMADRAPANILLSSIESIAVQNPRKSSPRDKSQEKSFKKNMRGLGVEVKTKKETSLTKKNISLEISSRKETIKEERSSSARKLLTSLWNAFSPNQKVAPSMKIKENSLEKHKKLKDFFS